MPNVRKVMIGDVPRGPTKVVPISEQRERAEMVERLYVMGLPIPSIEKTLRETYGAAAAKQLRIILARVKARWAEEEAAHRSMWKQQAIRRMQVHIAKAHSKNAFGAVAQLERLLAEMQGTREPEEIHITTTTVNEAAMQVITALTPAELAELASEQREVLKLAGERKSEILAEIHADNGARAPKDGP